MDYLRYEPMIKKMIFQKKKYIIFVYMLVLRFYPLGFNVQYSDVPKKYVDHLSAFIDIS